MRELGLFKQRPSFFFLAKTYFENADDMKNDDQPNQQWWRFGHVWLVIALPAVVVVASFITLYLAMSRPNEIISDDSYQPSRQSDQSIEARRRESSMAPAMLGRNHATTGVVPAPK